VLMAFTAKMESSMSYRVQLVIFSVAACVAMCCGVNALFQRSWAVVGLRWLSGLAACLWLGAAASIVLWPSTLGFGVRGFVAALIAPWALPFVMMARAVGRPMRRPTEPSVLQTAR
jgi:hypothetical protein